MITQNVDLLHTKAGSRNVVNLHGTYAEVICLDCGHTMTRAALAELLEAANPGFAERAEAVGGIAVAPDADAVVGDTSSFTIVDCPACGGMLKPNIVYFGESVPKDRVAQAYAMVDEADALLVAGSSLTVFSGYRFVRHAAAPRHSDRDRQPRATPAATTWRRSRSTPAAPRCSRCSPTSCPRGDDRHDRADTRCTAEPAASQILPRRRAVVAEHRRRSSPTR